MDDTFSGTESEQTAEENSQDEFVNVKVEAIEGEAAERSRGTNRQTGKQMTHLEMLNKANKFELSFFNMTQCVICFPVWRFVPRDRSAAKGP